MSSTHPDSPHELADLLSAYLDGELDPQTSRQLDERLANDPAAREELRRLENAWRMLDDLPRAASTPNFTATTVEMIALGELSPMAASGHSLTAVKWRMWLGRAAVVVVSALIGYAVMSWSVPDPNRALLADWNVIQNFDAYRYAGDVAWLRTLRAENLFTNPVPPVAPAPPRIAETSPAPTLPGPAPTDPQLLAAYVAALSPTEKEAVRLKALRFAQLPPEEQDRLRAIDRELHTTADGPALRETLDAYRHWLSGLRSVERAELAQLTTEQRIDSIRKSLQRTAQRTARRVSPSDARVIVAFMEQHALASLPQERREELQKLDEQERRRALGRMFWQRWATGDLSKGPLAIGDDELTALRATLSPSAQQSLQRLSRSEARVLLGDWVRQSVSQTPERREGGGTWVSQERLKRFWESELPDSEREPLMTLPADEMQARLRRLYFQRMGGGNDGPRGREFGPGGPPPPPGGELAPGERPPGESGPRGPRQRGSGERSSGERGGPGGGERSGSGERSGPDGERGLGPGGQRRLMP